MFNIGNKIKRAWNTIWQYKVLWIFAFLLVLFGGSAGSVGSGSPKFNYGFNQNDMRRFNYDMNYGRYNTNGWMNEMGTFMQEKVQPLFMPDRLLSTVLWSILIMLGITLLVGLLTALVRYPVETSMIRMVDDYEATGNKVKFKQGWRLGWNRRAFRIWVIDLIIGAPVFVVFAGMAIGVTVMVTNMMQTNSYTPIPGMIGMIILAGFIFLVLAIVMVFVGLWRQFIVRAVAIDDAGIGAAFKQGWAMIAHNGKNAFLTWLVMLGIGIGFGIAMILVLFFLIPAFALMVLPGALVSAIPGAIAFGIASIFTSGVWVWIIAALVALPFFVMIVASPATFVGGLYNLFSSSIWTQTYREMKSNNPPAITSVEPVAVAEK